MMSNKGTSFDGFQKDQYHAVLNGNQTIWDGGASSLAEKLENAKADAQQSLEQIKSTRISYRRMLSYLIGSKLSSLYIRLYGSIYSVSKKELEERANSMLRHLGMQEHKKTLMRKVV